MDAIIKNENVYVVVKDKKVREGVNLTSPELILIDSGYNKTSLYGGRVNVSHSSHNAHNSIEIDGITIYRFFVSYSGVVATENNFSLDKISAFLNQIENLGVDSFLENYKKQLQELKKEFEVMAENIQHELSITQNQDQDKIKLLESLKKILVVMACVIFSLLINMNAGLTNQHYINAYDTVINMYF